MAKPIERSAVADQVLGAFVAQTNMTRAADELAALMQQDISLEKALGEMQRVRDFLGTPEKILGNPNTKHGEIAEVMEVHTSNAKDIVEGLKPTGTLNVPGGRTGMVDYQIDGVDFQSKFHNGLRNSLDAINGHSGNYPGYLPDGGNYTLPKDQFDQLTAISKGEPVDLSTRKADNIREWLRKYEEETGKPFTETIKPSVSSYDEVQQGVAHDTVEKHEDSLKERNEERKDDIRVEHEASFTEGVKVSAQAAAIAGGISFATMAWKFHRQGRNIFKGELTSADWKALGVEVGTSAGVAAVTAGGIYALTNCAGMAAPLAGALATAAKGLGSLALDYHAGRINLDQFVKEGLYVCSETAVVSLASMAGQALIPIPVVGALIGSLAAKYFLSLAKKLVAGITPKVKQIETALEKVIAKYEVARKLLYERFGHMDQLIKDAFDPALNLKLVETSVALARDAGVDEANILKGHQDLESFLRGEHQLSLAVGSGSPRLAAV
jgi:hypothetical protein